MRMLCIAAAHDPIGYVAVAGRALDETSLARMTGCQESEARALLGELDQNGVFSRDRQGRIYSRRMVADAKKAAIARKNGKNGGNPSLRKERGNPASDNPSVKVGLKPQEPEARYSDTNVSGEAAQPPPAAPDHDKLAWSEAVRVITTAGASEKSARSFFGKLLADHKLLARDLLPSLTSAAVNGTQDPQSYLRRAAAGVAQRRGPSGDAPVPQPDTWDDDRWRIALDIFRETGRWGANCGPEPGKPGCRVPSHLTERKAA
jgi:hypothetical protein